MSGVFSAPPTPPRKREVFVEPAEKAFHFEVPEGWTAEGSLKRSKPNGRYIIANLGAPGGGLIFAGHPDLPLRFAAPAPWHGFWPPGQRVTFNGGTPAEEAFYQSPLMTAPQACQHLAARRFGPCAVRSATKKDDVVQEVATGLRQAGGFAAFIDACRAEIVSSDGQKAGVIELCLFGGGNPGETWQIENITGFWAPVAQWQATYAAYDIFIRTLKPGDRWQETNRDEAVPAMGDYVHGVFAKADKQDLEAEREAARVRLATTKAILDEMKKSWRH